MGVTYKLKPEIISFIIEKKKTHPAISCRSLSELIQDNFKTTVSKSSINKIFKEAGLSMPIGRRAKKPRRPPLKLQILTPPESVPVPPRIEPIPEPPKEEPIILQPIVPEEVTIAEPVIKPPEEVPIISEPIAQEEVVEEKTPEPVVEKPVEFKPDIIAEAKPEILIEGETTGAILLKAADFIIGGITRFNEVIRTRMHIPSLGVLNRTGGLIYSKLTSGQNLWPLINQRVTDEELSSYLIELQQVTILNSDLLQAMPMLFKDARGIKISLSTNALLYLDSQFYTIWSTPHIPYSFSASIDRIRTYINKYLLGNGPFILMMAPGYDIPTSEFFDFVLGLDAPDKEPITAVSFYGNNLQDIESTKIESIKKRNIIFGLWPSQFIQYRKVNKIKEFKPFLFTPLNKEFYIAEIELELSQPNTHKTLTFRGCALKLSPTEKTRLVILSNFPSENLNLEELCSTYLSHWPNLEEAFQDYSRKVELFTYAAASEHQFSTAITGIMGEPAQDISLFFDNYLKVLDLFVKWNFLPAGYENKDFPTIKAQFYDLPVSIRPEKSHYSVLFKIPSQYTYANDLKYACRRLNEKEITAPDGKRYWFSC